MKKNLLLLLLFLVVGVSSCVRKEYDLTRDNLDLKVKIGSDDLFIPIGQTDSLFLRNFLDTADIELLQILSDNSYAIILEGTEELEIPEIDASQLAMDDIVHQRTVTIDFKNSIDDFPDVDLPNINEQKVFNSGLYLTAQPANGGSIPSFPPVGLTEEYPLVFSEPLPAEIIKVDSVLLTDPANFEITISVQNLPGGAMIEVDTIRVVFPPQVKLGADPRVFGQTYLITNSSLTTTPLEVTIPIRHLDFSSTPLQSNNSLSMDEEIVVYSKYSVEGTYNGGFYPTTFENDTRLVVKVNSNLNYSSAYVQVSMVSQEFQETTTPIDLEITDIPLEIIALDSALFQNAQIRMSVDKSRTSLGGQALEYHVNIQFPRDLIFAPGQGISATNQLVLQLSQTDSWEETYNVRGMRFDGNPLNGQLKIEDSITLQASIVANNASINTDTLWNTVVDLDVDATFANIVFSKVFGRIDPQIESQFISVPLDDLPEMLKGDDMVFHVYPRLGLEMTTNLQIPLDATVILTPWKGGQIVPNAQQDITISVPAWSGVGQPQPVKYWIAETTTGMPAGYTHINRNLGTLVKRVPDSIQIEIVAGTDPTQQAIFDVDETYFANVDYDFVVPFAFGPELLVSIQDTIRDLGEDLGRYLSGNSVGLSGKIWNSIPLELNVVLIPVNDKYEPIDIDHPTLKIDAGKVDGSAAESLLDFLFDDPSGKLSDMRHVIFKFTGRTGQDAVPGGVAIKPDNFIKVQLRAKISGGLTIDLNDFLDSNSEGGND